jgi:hypothetical protein
VLWRQLKRR